MLFAGKERDGQINQVETTKRSVSVYKLTFCIDCATGRCLQARKEMEKSIKFRQQGGRECVLTYRLHRLCHRAMFTGKERDGQINQVQTTKKSVSVYKLTHCIDCATMMFAGKVSLGKSTVQTTKTSVCCLNLIDFAQGGVCRKERDGKSIKFRQQRGQ